jgi:hypothetical protein
MGMCFGSDGNLYCTRGSYITKVGSDGTTEVFVEKVNASWPSLYGIDCDSDGNFFVNGGDGYVYKVSADGESIDTFARVTSSDYGYGLAADSRGNIFSAVEWGNTIAWASVGGGIHLSGCLGPMTIRYLWKRLPQSFFAHLCGRGE